MGAPGEAHFCENGHLYEWIDDDLYWDEGLWNQSKAAVCPCGAPRKIIVCHYGLLGDCIGNGKEIHPIGKEKFLRPFPAAVNAEGRKVEGIYSEVELDRYDLSEICPATE